MDNVKKIGIKLTEHSGLNLFGASKCPNCSDRSAWHSVVLEGLAEYAKIRGK